MWRKTHQEFESIIPERLGYGIGIGREVDWSEVPEIGIHKETESVLKEGYTIHVIPWIHRIFVCFFLLHTAKQKSFLNENYHARKFFDEILACHESTQGTLYSRMQRSTW